MKALLLLALMAGTPALGRPTHAVRYVDCDDGNDAADGLTWETAKRTLVAGLSDGISADVVPEVNLRGRCIVPEAEFPDSTETCKGEPRLPPQGAILRGPAVLRVGCTSVRTNLGVLGADTGTRYLLDHLDFEAIDLRHATVDIRDSTFIGLGAQDVDLSLSHVQMRPRGEPEDGLAFFSTGPGGLSVSDAFLDGGDDLPLGVYLSDGVVGFPPVTIERTTFGFRGAEFTAGEDSHLKVQLRDNVFLDATSSVSLFAAGGADLTVVFQDNVFDYEEPPAVWVYGDGMVKLVGDVREARD